MVTTAQRFNHKRCAGKDQHAQEHLALEEIEAVFPEGLQGKLRIALVLANDLDDVDRQADHDQGNNHLGPHVRHQVVGILCVALGNLGLQHMGEESEHHEHQQEDIGKKFKQRILNSLQHL